MSFRLHDPDALAVEFEQVIILIFLFTMLFANQTMICSTSTAHGLLVFSCLLNPSDFEQVIVPGICFMPCLLTRY